MTSLNLDEEQTVANALRSMAMKSPFKDQTPTEILERMILVADSAYGASTSSDVTMYALLNAAHVIRVLAMFTLFRADLKVRVVIASVPQQYGALLVAKFPWTNESINTYYENGSANPVILDIAGAQTCEFVLPFNAPNKYVPVWPQIYSDFVAYMQYMWTVYIGTLAFNTLDPSVTQTFRVKVFMGFVNVELAGPRATNYYEQSGPLAEGVSFFRNVATGAKDVMQTMRILDDVQKEFMSAFGDYFSIAEEETNQQNGGQQSLKMNPFGDVSTSASNAQLTPLGLHRNHKMFNPSLFQDESGGYHKILTICQKPSIFGVQTLTSAGTRKHIIVKPTMNLTSTSPSGYGKSPCYMGYLSRLFKFWRGGIKLFFSFHASPLVLFRVQISIQFLGGGGVAYTAGVTTPGTIYSDVISIRGSTSYKLTVPYLSSAPWQYTYQEDDDSEAENYSLRNVNPIVTIDLIDVAKGMGSTTPDLFIVCAAAAGDDFQFRTPISYRPFATDAVESLKGKEKEEEFVMVTEQCDLNSEFVTPFRNPFGDVLTPDPYKHGPDCPTYIEELLHRYETVSETVTTNQSFSPWPHPLSVSGAANATVSNFDWICNLFQWFSGSVNVKGSSYDETLKPFYITNPSLYPTIVDASENYITANGASIVVPKIWKNFDVEVPYYQPFPCSIIRNFSEIGDWLPQPPGITFIQDGATSSDIQLFKAAGKSFQLSYLLPVPQMSMWPR